MINNNDDQIFYIDNEEHKMTNEYDELKLSDREEERIEETDAELPNPQRRTKIEDLRNEFSSLHAVDEELVEEDSSFSLTDESIHQRVVDIKDDERVIDHGKSNYISNFHRAQLKLY